MFNLPPLAFLLILLAIALVARLTLMHRRPSATAGGSIVMAIGIFGQAALQRIPLLPSLVSELLALLLGVIWLFIAVSFLFDLLKGRFHIHTHSMLGRFGVGTWVAATVVLARMEMIGVPSWSIATEEAFGLVAGLLWLWYMYLVATGLYAIAASRHRLRANGVILLSAVSTQAIALVAIDLSYSPNLEWIDYWNAHLLFHRIATILNKTGAAFYVVCLALIVQRYWRQKDWTLIHDWDNTNCIVHGGMAITGLTAVLTGTAPFTLCLAIWCYAAFVFVLVEGLEIARAGLRVRSLGWREGLFTYHVSQWARNFTFGMFYAFTWVFMAHFYAYLPPTLSTLFQGILEYGPYLVLGLLIIQTGIYLRAGVRPGLRKPAEEPVRSL